MPRTLVLSPALRSLIASQDGVASTAQLAAHGFSASAVQHRVGRGLWIRPAPGVVLTSGGPPTRRQLLLSAVLWAGTDAAIDGPDACAWYGLAPHWFRSAQVHVVVPASSRARTRGFVVVRRSMSDIAIGDRGLVPYVQPAIAVVAATRRAPSVSSAVAFLSLALQRGMVTTDTLTASREHFGDKWCRRVDTALAAVGVGVRSPAEKQAHELFGRSPTLPSPRWNVWLDLGDGGPLVCVDALWEDAGLVAEINGRAYHAWGEQFEHMHRRGGRLVAAGLTVLHCTPRQLSQHGVDVLHQLERAYARQVGSGLPSGVRAVSPPPIAA